MKRALPLVGNAFLGLCGTVIAADGSGSNPAELRRVLGSVLGAIVGLMFLAGLLK
jgi:hypothetical protein